MRRVKQGIWASGFAFVSASAVAADPSVRARPRMVASRTRTAEPRVAKNGTRRPLGRAVRAFVPILSKMVLSFRPGRSCPQMAQIFADFDGAAGSVVRICVNPKSADRSASGCRSLRWTPRGRNGQPQRTQRGDLGNRRLTNDEFPMSKSGRLQTGIRPLRHSAVRHSTFCGWSGRLGRPYLPPERFCCQWFCLSGPGPALCALCAVSMPRTPGIPVRGYFFLRPAAVAGVPGGGSGATPSTTGTGGTSCCHASSRAARSFRTAAWAGSAARLFVSRGSPIRS